MKDIDVDVIKHDDDLPDHQGLPCQKERIEERDWECIAVLDAARYDVADSSLPGVEPLRTPSDSSTIGWIKDVWKQDGWEDVTYVMGNPVPISDDVREEHGDCMDDYLTLVDGTQDAWDKIVGTCRPDTLTDIAMEYEPPLVVHYFQPHTPHIGDFAIKCRGDIESIMPDPEDTGMINRPDRLAYSGQISMDVFKASYISNFNLVYEETYRLRNKFDNMVITSDHGEGLGYVDWDHGDPDSNSYRTVPWYECN